MKFWCGDYTEDEWVIGLPWENLVFWVVVAAVFGVIWWKVTAFFEADKAKREAEAKAKATEEKNKADAKAADEKKKAEEKAAEDKKKAEETIKKDKEELAASTKKNILATLDAKLRELQDAHRSVMISDQHNRIVWIAEGIRQARDAIENTK
jgi:cytoskeletal protein RodZ